MEIGKCYRAGLFWPVVKHLLMNHRPQSLDLISLVNLQSDCYLCLKSKIEEIQKEEPDNLPLACQPPTEHTRYLYKQRRSMLYEPERPVLASSSTLIRHGNELHNPCSLSFVLLSLFLSFFSLPPSFSSFFLPSSFLF